MLQRLLKHCNNKIPLTYQAMVALMKRAGEPNKPLDPPGKLDHNSIMNPQFLKNSIYDPPSLQGNSIKRNFMVLNICFRIKSENG